MWSTIPRRMKFGVPALLHGVEELRALHRIGKLDVFTARVVGFFKIGRAHCEFVKRPIGTVVVVTRSAFCSSSETATTLAGNACAVPQQRIVADHGKGPHLAVAAKGASEVGHRIDPRQSSGIAFDAGCRSAPNRSENPLRSGGPAASPAALWRREFPATGLQFLRCTLAVRVWAEPARHHGKYSKGPQEQAPTAFLTMGTCTPGRK